MGEYISKQEVIDYLNGYLHSLVVGRADNLLINCGQRKALTNAIQDITAVKAADVQLVRYGHWIEEVREVGGFFKLYQTYIHCSECGKEHYSGTLPKPNFCDNCGARMDK